MIGLPAGTGRFLLAVCALALVLASCSAGRGPAARRPIPGDVPHAEELLAALGREAASRRALRGVARVAIDGPYGDGRSKQIIALEPPYRLRVEVLGLLDQTIALLVSDGSSYRLVRNDRSVDRGEVHDAMLNELTGLELTPPAAAGFLLAAPFFEDPSVAHAEAMPGGGVRITATGDVRFEGQQLEFDAGGYLARWSMPGWIEARYGAWRPLADGVVFPHEVELLDQRSGASLRIVWSRVELNPELPASIFALPGAANP